MRAETLSASSPLVLRLRPGPEVDPLLTLSALAHGPGDPHVLLAGSTVLRASRTAGGSVGMRLDVHGGEVAVQAWGAGAECAVEQLPDLLGINDDPSPFRPFHGLVDRLWRRFAGLRLTRTRGVVEMLVPTIVAQKVTGLEAGRSYRAIVRRFGEPAPGPLAATGLRVPPSPAVLAAQPYHVFHPLGIERRRAEAIIAVCRAAARLEETVDMPLPAARRRLLAVPGVGPWTAAEVARIALGDPDAVSVGDYNLPHLVGWALAGEARANDDRMLELLAPYGGQRARAVRLLELSGIMPPRHGPRMPARGIAAI